MDQKNLEKLPFTIHSGSDGVTWMSADLATSTDWKTILTYSVNSVEPLY